jgi:hypothetical protein
LKDSGEVVIGRQLPSLTNQRTFLRMPVNSSAPRIPAQSRKSRGILRVWGRPRFGAGLHRGNGWLVWENPAQAPALAYHPGETVTSCCSHQKTSQIGSRPRPGTWPWGADQGEPWTSEPTVGRPTRSREITGFGLRQPPRV